MSHYRQPALYKDPEWLRNEYVTLRRTTDEIAAQCSVNGTTIIKAMKKAGIARRSVSESRMGRHLGEQNASWKGGVTPDRQRLYRTPAWRKFVQECFARDGFRCVKCKSPKLRRRGLHAHHLQSWAENPDLRMDANNVVTLCDVCHRWVHSSENFMRELIF